MEDNKIIEMYTANESIDSICEEFGLEEKEVRKILKDNNIDRKYNFFSDELYQRIIYLYLKGFTQKEICGTLLIGGNVIRTTLKKNNIPMRSSSECNQRYKRNAHYFDNIDNPNKAYILGMIYADGCNYTNHNSLTISLQERDKDILERIKEELEYDGPLRFSPLHSKNANYMNHWVLNINDEYMSKKLQELGVINNKSLLITFPDFLQKELYPSFIRGYFDGDGNIYYDSKRNKCQTQTVGTRDFCNTLSNILFSMGCKNNIKHPKQCHEDTVVIQTSGNKSSYKFLSWLYEDADMKLERKYNQYLSFKEKYC